MLIYGVFSCKSTTINKIRNGFLAVTIHFGSEKANGDEYPPNSLYSICCGMMRYIREVKPELNFFTSPEFTGLQQTLDGEMKRLRALGQGVKRKRAEHITVNKVDAMWEKGLLGCSSLGSVLLFEVDRSLRFCQLELFEV